LQPNDRVLQFTPLSFDVSIEEMLPSWLAGSRVVLRNQEVLGSIPKFLDFIQREAITVLNLPTAYFHALTESIRPTDLPASVRLLVIGGEQVMAPRWALWHEQADRRVQVINAYGLTEACITNTLFRNNGESSGSTVPIGRPISNTTAYILDPDLQPLPVGVPGELFVGGPGVARGYRSAPELNARIFLQNPFSPGPNQRLYRTGDLARFRADGNIELLGRLDDQVKLRGFRIQLSEIEAALARHPAIAQAIVHATAYGDRDERLVAYFVSSGAGVATAGELISFLQKLLPEFMIPSAFVKLETLPLTPSGKIDHKKLPLPGTTRPGLNEPFVAPQSELEERIAAVWREVLHVDEVGVNDNFFNLGGHSLHAMQVMSRLGHALKLNIPVSNLFEAPTVATLAAAIVTQSSQLRTAVSGPIPRKSETTDADLSFAQQRVWFLNQLQPELPLYNLAQAIHLCGPIQVGMLEKAFREVVRRHDVLRTTYVLKGGHPVQTISRNGSFSLPVTDLSKLASEPKDRQLRETTVAEARKPFLLDQDLMLRALLLKLSDEEHVLLVTTHHIAADGWSIEVLWKEVSACYRSLLEDRPSPLPPLPVQYADFALWQLDWLQGAILDSQLAYWRTQLDGIPPLLELPLDHPRPALQTYRGARQSVALPGALTDKLRIFGQSEGCTLFMTLLAGFESLLFRYSHCEDIVVGTVNANRYHPEREPLIGYFANTLVLRTQFSEDPGFRAILRRTRKTTLDAYAHQDLPFERLVEELQPGRDPSYHPIFQVMFVLQNVPVPSQAMPELTVQPSDLDTGISKFDLLLNFVETGHGLSGFLEYSTDLFEQDTVERMMGHFQTLLQSAVAAPDLEVSRLQLLSEPERKQLLVDWNSGRVDVPTERCIHQMFEAHAAATPERIAIVCGDQRATYADLNTRSNRLAHYLRALGAGPGTLIGLCTSRSIEMVAAMLATLKAGAAYVPMDPTYPRERLQWIIEDARLAIILTEMAFGQDLNAPGTQVVCLDTLNSALESNSPEKPGEKVGRNDLAYVLFTSGSTGRPKGVAVEHRSVLALAAWAKSEFSDEELKGVLAGTSICFDLSVFEIFMPLALGGRVILAPDVLQIAAIPARNEVRLINTVPSAIAELLRLKAIPDSVRTINLAGELLPQSLVEALYELPHVQRVLDLYGPTEATVYSTWALRTRGGRNNIGRPLPNEQLYVLDTKLEPAPFGVPGELFIAGAGLARGYLNQPELTADRFFKNPFSPDPEARMYRTGDLVRYLPDGNVEYLGRIDQQVKIRGFRIELGEIEAHLRKHSNLSEAIVVPDDEVSREKRLVAYIVPAQEPGPTAGELREHLKQTLPEYMVPSLFVSLDALPRTPNGKLNRKALPKPDPLIASAASVDQEPTTDAEILVAQIWCDVLNLSQVGIHQNFFELGGHSLMITRILVRLRDAVEVELPMKSIFEAPTVAQLAVLVESAMLVQISDLSEDELQESVRTGFHDVSG